MSAKRLQYPRSPTQPPGPPSRGEGVEEEEGFVPAAQEATPVEQEGLVESEQDAGGEEITPRVDEGLGQQGLAPWLIVTIVLGAAAVSAAFAFGVVVLVRRRPDTKTKAPPVPPMFARENPRLLPSV